jgi:four helix bundle protein
MQIASSFHNYRFEDLEVWRLSLKIVHQAYLVGGQFPKTEIFSLTDQLKRAATSIALNIAEGSGQPTTKGFRVYIHRAKSSAIECVAALKIAAQENFAHHSEIDELQKLLKEIYFKLIALNKSI